VLALDLNGLLNPHKTSYIDRTSFATSISSGVLLPNPELLFLTDASADSITDGPTAPSAAGASFNADVAPLFFSSMPASSNNLAV